MPLFKADQQARSSGKCRRIKFRSKIAPYYKDRFQASVSPTDKGKYPDSDVRFDRAPYLNFNDGKLKFGTKTVGNANPNYGGASGFLPKLLLYLA